MLKSWVISAGALAWSAIGGAVANAQDAAIGQAIYQDRCSVCHGDGGAGDGLVAALFDKKPINLTQISKRNGGVFPFESVYQAIDGRREIRAHGFSRMPIWGEYFMQDAITDRAIDPKDAKSITQGRILAVVYYLQSIQSD